MEPVGLTLGAFALVTLCSTCLEAFNLINTAGEISLDREVLSIRLHMEKARLLQWAEGVGLVAYDLRSRHVSLSSGTTQLQIERVLKAIERLLTKSNDLVSRYGLVRELRMQPHPPSGNEVTVSSERTQKFRKDFTRFLKQRLSYRQGKPIFGNRAIKQRLSHRQEKPRFGKRAKWAIKDHEKFIKLLNSLHDLIEGLHHLVPVPKEFQRLMIEEDINSLPDDLLKLRLLKMASDDGPAEWRDCVSLRVEQSQQATQDFRTIEEWRQDINTSGESNQCSLSFDQIKEKGLITSERSATTPVIGTQASYNETPTPLQGLSSDEDDEDDARHLTMSESIFCPPETIYWYNQQPALVPYHDCYSPKECKTVLEELWLPGSNRNLDPSDAPHLLKILESLLRTYESTPLNSKSHSVFQRERVEELCNHAVQTRSSTSNYRPKLPRVKSKTMTRIYSGRIEMKFKDTEKSFSLDINYERLGKDENAYQYYYELRLEENGDGLKSRIHRFNVQHHGDLWRIPLANSESHAYD